MHLVFVYPIAPNGAVAAEKIAEGNKADKAGHGGTVIKEKRKTETKRRKQTNARTERILAENGLSVKREGSIRDGNTNGKTAEPVSRRKGYLKNHGIPTPNRPKQPCLPATGYLKIFQVAFKLPDSTAHHQPETEKPAHSPCRLIRLADGAKALMQITITAIIAT